MALVWVLCMTGLSASASGSCAAPQNPIEAENCNPGSPSSEWDVSAPGDLSIQGFATDISVNQGQTVFFTIDTDANNYSLDIYRLGYYGGMGARKITTISLGQNCRKSSPPA